MRRVSVLWCTAMVLVACGGGAGRSTSSGSTLSPVTSGVGGTRSGTVAAVDGLRCVLSLHGKGGGGGDTYDRGDGVLNVSPTGNADGWGGKQWIYFPDDRRAEAVEVVRAAITQERCAQVILYGFSNGAAFAAAVYCSGETFDGTLRRVVVDDPVPDTAVQGCTPPPAVPVTLYWTGGLAASATPGADCEAIDWTCAGGTMIGIDAYAAALGVPATPSIHGDHQPYSDAPELTQW